MNENPDSQRLLRFLTVGVEFIAAFGICLAVGVYVDRKRGGGVLGTVLGAAVGFAAALYRLVRTAKEFRPQDKERKDPP